MSVNTLYFDHGSIEQTAYELTNVHTRCTQHGTSKDSYASPAFSEWKKSALTVDDIPMQSYLDGSSQPLREDQHKAPWEDSIKNFIFDTVSLSTSSKFITCILLSEIGYKYQEATIHMIAGKYGKQNVTLIDVMPCDYTTGCKYEEFKLRVRHKDVHYESIIDSATLTSTLVQWYVPNDTVIFCHDNSIEEYENSLAMMPDSTWSVACSYTNYIVNKSGKKCRYICPNFACPGSLETRAVSSGPALFTGNNAPASYKGKLDYYFRSVRISKHYSGKCYDCKILEKAVNDIYKSPMSTPISARSAEFSSTFLSSVDRSSNLSQDSGYGSSYSPTKLVT